MFVCNNAKYKYREIIVTVSLEPYFPLAIAAVSVKVDYQKLSQFYLF